MSRAKKIFIDANVFVASWTLDVLLTLADTGLVEPHWSDEVICEARKTITKLGGSRRRGSYIGAAEAAYPYASVPLEDADFIGIELPDPNDRHVLAGAKVAECDFIVTYNVKDFPEEVISRQGMRAVHPDEFLTEIAKSDPNAVLAAISLLVATKEHPPRSLTEEVAGLKANRLQKFADFIEAHIGNDE